MEPATLLVWALSQTSKVKSCLPDKHFKRGAQEGPSFNDCKQRHDNERYTLQESRGSQNNCQLAFSCLSDEEEEEASFGLKDKPGNRFHLKLSWRQNSPNFCHDEIYNSPLTSSGRMSTLTSKVNMDGDQSFGT
jgi:hypothetical protein